MAFWNRFRKKGRQDDLPAAGMDGQAEGLEKTFDGEERNLQTEDGRLRQTKSEWEQEEVLPVYQEDKKRFVQESCEAVRENERQISLARKEYEEVTEYLTDIQKIDRLEGEERERLLDDCRRIQKLMRERSQYKNRNLTITEAQIRRFDRYEEDLVPEIQKMYQAQSYQQAIEKDMGHLEDEKKKLYAQRKEITMKQSALKKMAKVLFALIVSLMVLFVALHYALKTDMTMPYLATLLLAAVSAAVIFMEANRNRRDMALEERKLTKAISLLNRVKIKYVNNASMLEYDCEKYGVKNAADFEALWKEYCRAREYERRFRENTEQMNRYNEDMLELLRKIQVREPEIWLSQTEAILDSREMVEIRHELNQRRQKLREQIQYNTEVKELQLEKIDRIINESPALREELLQLVRSFGQET